MLQPVAPPVGSHAGALSQLVSLSARCSQKIHIVLFLHCSVTVVNGHKSFCGRIKGVINVYTCCSILGFFFKGTCHLLQLMDSRCKSWLRFGNSIFPLQWLISAFYSLVLVLYCCIPNYHKVNSLKLTLFYYHTVSMDEKHRHGLAESST